ncbi:Fur family transcriptional regulator [Parvularcula sp. LCG005]|uniref:Fur family transcriptional regulator n=1 Tax=Parvularcula sp. LCG005 TaxID=3078805 RepID=UPI002942061C|nr:Fur family transcriptional regulator [Parvularcula sp. LCG005]WOI52642.1 Fur family transcriptional regulator [Parvularcula sp. LCG005]
MAHQAANMEHTHTVSQRLTRNERLVLEVLGQTEGPMKAYELLASLKDHGIKAPMTVYRALDRLESKGLIHKLDAINSFVICNHETPHPVQTFLVCSQCSRAEELEESRVKTLEWSVMRSIAQPKGFTADSARIEIRGICMDCRDAA